jgi:tRNA uridine 5-carbamoylmethylation protein Kti12
MALSKESRKSIIEKYRPFASKIIAIFVNTPIDICFKRNQGRPNPVSYDSYLEHLEEFEHPTKDEGFDEVIEVDNA